MNLDQQVKNVASQGRYGDSMLLHVNPAEVRGLSQVAPITVNPQTGQPEAFLPFLAPLLGSFALPAMASASGLGALSGLTGLAGSALGSGLAQWAATGDVKKGLLAGLTGYGIGQALQGGRAALTAATGEKLATDMASGAGELGTKGADALIKRSGAQAGNLGMQTAIDQTPGKNFLDILTGNPTVDDSVMNPLNQAFTNPTLISPNNIPTTTYTAPASGMSLADRGSALAAGISQPQALVPITAGMLPTAMMESQEAWNQDVLRRQEEEEESRRQNFLMNPEVSLYAQGGMTELDQGLQMDANLLSNPMGQGVNAFSTGGFVPGITDEGNIVGTRTAQRFAPARKAYAVNPDYMAGFQPETMYFQPSTLNQPATGLTEGGAPKPVDDYMGTRGGYGGPSMSMGASQVIDPYAAYTGPAPEGLIQGAPAPLPQGMSYDIPVDTTTESPTTTESEPVLYDEPLPFVTPGGTQGAFLGGIAPNLIPGIPGVGQGYVSDFDSADQMQTLDYSDYPKRSDYGSSEDGGNLEFKQAQNEWFQGQIPSVNIPGQTSGITNVDTGSMVGPMLPPGTVPPIDFSAGDIVGPDGTLEQSSVYQPTPNLPEIPPVVQPPVVQSKDSSRDYYTAYPGGVPGFYGNPNLGGIYQGFAEGGDTGNKKRFVDYQPEGPLKGTFFDYIPDAYQVSAYLKDRFGGMFPDKGTPPVSQLQPMEPQGPMLPSQSIREQFDRSFAEARRKGDEEFTFRGDRYHTKTKEEVNKKAVGGMIESPVTEAPLQAAEQANDLMQDPVTQETIQFILGETDNQQVVNDFISKYGTEMFLQLRDSVLKSLVPDAQTEGLVEGQGQSGMADDIPGRIGADEKIAVSQDEFIVPADVVSSLGDGSSDAGSNRLYEMMDRVRQAKTGGTTQPPMLDLNKVMPA